MKKDLQRQLDTLQSGADMTRQYIESLFSRRKREYSTNNFSKLMNMSDIDFGFAAGSMVESLCAAKDLKFVLKHFDSFIDFTKAGHE